MAYRFNWARELRCELAKHDHSTDAQLREAIRLYRHDAPLYLQLEVEELASAEPRMEWCELSRTIANIFDYVADVLEARLDAPEPQQLEMFTPR